MRTGMLVAAATAGTVAVLGVGATPGFAANQAVKMRPIAAIRPVAMSMVVLTVAHGENARPAQRRATLTCNPAGGTVNQPRQACAEISTAKGDLTKLPAGDGMCMMLYDPVTVTASGHWKGRALKYTHTYSNSCVLKQETGAVFSF